MLQYFTEIVMKRQNHRVFLFTTRFISSACVKDPACLQIQAALIEDIK